MADERKSRKSEAEELVRIIVAASENGASDEDRAQLAELLQHDPTMRQTYIELMHQENSLHYSLGSDRQQPSTGIVAIAVKQTIDTVAPQEAARSIEPFECSLDANTHAPPTYLLSRWLSAWPVLAGMLVLAMLTGWIVGRRSAHDLTQTEPSRPLSDNWLDELPNDHSIPIAAEIVTYSPDCRWGLMDLAVMPGGTSLRPGQPIQLSSGSAEIRFVSGAVVVLQGPATLEVQSGKSGFLRSGKATFVAGSQSIPLTVLTPSSRAVLDGAELGVVVGADGTSDIRVLAGEAEVVLLNEVGLELSRERLIEGLAGRFQASEKEMERIELSDQLFLREVYETYIAYQNRAGFSGNQSAFEGALGMDFVVKDPIEITKLGVFDSDADGLKRPIVAELWTRNEAGTAYRFTDDSGGEILAVMEFTPEDPGELVDSNCFKALDHPLRLEPGAYTIVAHGYGELEPNGNEGNIHFCRERNRMIYSNLDEEYYGHSRSHKALDDGKGAILFVGSSRWDDEIGVFPRVVDPGSVNRYRAGTFEFRRAAKMRRKDNLRKPLI